MKRKKTKNINNKLFAVELNELKTYFVDKEELFQRYKKHVLDGSDKTKRRIFIDNGEPILFVAHADTVQKPRIDKIDKKAGICYGAGFDDRLGIYTIFKLLNNGFKADVLITDNEETGDSTARNHVLKDYDLIVEFDRAGVDVVTYDRDCSELLSKLGELWPIGYGSYSDVCAMDTMTCTVNIGMGIRESHSPKSCFILADYYRALLRFKTFYSRIKGVTFRCEFKPVQWGFDSYYDDEGIIDVCDVCGHTGGEEIHGDCMTSFMMGDNSRLYSEDDYGNDFIRNF